MLGKGKKMLKKIILHSLDGMNNKVEENGKKNVKENIKIFSSILSLKKVRKIGEKRKESLRENFIGHNSSTKVLRIGLCFQLGFLSSMTLPMTITSSDNLPMFLKTYRLWAYESQWMECIY